EHTFDGSGSSDDVLVTNYTWTFTYDELEKVLWGVSPSFVFDAAGVYIVTLTVSDGESLSDTDTVTITVEEVVVENIAPVADAGADQTKVAGATVVFDGSGSSDSDGTIVSYAWNFTYDGEEKTMSGVAPSFVFETAGTYIVTLTVTDSDGDTDTDTVKIIVEAEDDVTDDDEKTFIEQYGLPIGVLAALAIVALLAIMLMKKGKGGKSSGVNDSDVDGIALEEPAPPEDQNL
ncbi:MAG: PKD domain-containing protein, partial [Thermoplasmata archaeon]|nr:PKD domain-containing protein [Thermoplasmata archaeon]